MKKMNKMYEAPKAEVIEIQAATVLMTSGAGTGETGQTGGGGGTGWEP